VNADSASAAGAGASASGGTSASGQPVQMSEVQVTGVRASLAESVALKRESDTISDSISSEDVGKFPVRNVADALQRITGVQVNRSYGEGSTINLRGLPADMVMNEYNGRQLPSPQGARSVDYSILPTDFIQSLTIYKSPTADMALTGLAGTVNIEPIKPLNLKERMLAVNVTGIYDYNSKKGNPELSAFYGDKFFDNTLGIAIGGQYSKRAIAKDWDSTWYFEPRQEVAPGTSALYPNGFDANHNGVYTDTYRLWHYTDDREEFGTRQRKSLTGMLQWHPNESFEFHGDYLYTWQQNDITPAAVEIRNTNAAGGFSDTVTDPNNDIVAMHVANNQIFASAFTGRDLRLLQSLGLGGTWTPNEKWTVSANASKGQASDKLNSNQLLAYTYQDTWYDMRKDPSGLPSWGFSNPNFNLLDPNNYYITGIRGGLTRNKNEVHSGKLDVTFQSDWGWLKSIQFGGNQSSNYFQQTGYDTYTNNIPVLAQLAGQPVVTCPVVGGNCISAAPYMRLAPTGSNYLDSYSGPSQFPKNFLYADPYGFFNKYSIAQLVAAIPGFLQYSPNANVNERILAQYLRLNFGDADDRWSGTVGVRYEKTDTSVRTYSVVIDKIVYDPNADQFTSQANPTMKPSVLSEVSTSKGQWLPSFTFKYALNDDWVVRAAAAKEMTRPNLNDMSRSQGLEILQTPTGGGYPIADTSLGNPRLQPYLANSYDASLEWYFSKEGMASATVFYKDVSNWVFSAQEYKNYTIHLAGGGTRDIPFLVTSVANGGGLKIKGVELSYQQPFTFLPSPWDGFGVVANYTYVDAGNVTNKATGVTTPTLGISKSSYNASVYYEKEKFNLRLSYNFKEGYPGAYVMGPGAVSGPLDYWGVAKVYTKDYGQLDFSGGYKVNDWCEINFSIMNVLNKPDYQDYVQVGSAKYLHAYWQEGRIAQIGVHMKF
jgi:TonB-dependent receptor